MELNQPSDLITTSSAPSDKSWSDAAKSGTYSFVNTATAEDELNIDYDRATVMQVEDNYITKIINVQRNKNDEFDVSSIVSFSIEKGEVKTKTNSYLFGLISTTEKYRELKVTETTQDYKNGAASGQARTKTYIIKEEL